MNNFSDMISKAKKMQDQMKEVQNKLKNIEVEGVAGGNLVKVLLGGDYEMKSITVSPDAKNEKDDVEKANLFIKEIKVDGAGMLKRIRPAPQGRAHRIRKRSNHVTLVLGNNKIN